MLVYTTENHKVQAANKQRFLKVNVFTSIVTPPFFTVDLNKLYSWYIKADKRYNSEANTHSKK